MESLLYILFTFALQVSAQSNLSPNMSLPVSIIGTTSGLNWENNLNASLGIIDSHNHTPGFGVQIPVSGLNLNTDVPFNNHACTNLAADVFTPQASYATDDAVYVKGVDLYYRDGNGNEVQMTSGGVVNATSSGISSGTATASFVAGVLVVNSAANTPANIQGGSILLGNNVANSKYLTLSPPAAMASNITETLPAIPGAQSFMAIDTSGNMTSYAAVSGGLTGSNLSSSAGITGGQIATNTITGGASGNLATFTINGNNLTGTASGPTTGSSYSNNTSTFTSIVTVSFSPSGGTAHGIPRFVTFSGDAIELNNIGGVGTATLRLICGTTPQVLATWTITVPSTITLYFFPPSSFNWSGSGLCSGNTNYILQGKTSVSNLTLSSGGVTENITSF